MSSYVSRSLILLVILAFTVMMLTFDRAVTAGPVINQNSNSSTTTTQNSNTPTKRSSKSRSSKSKTQPTTEPSTQNANVTTEPTAGEAAPTGEAATPAPTRSTRRGRNTAAGSSVSMQATEQTDLSGTYTGTFVCDAAGMNGETTLTITGNQFTTSDGKTGRIVASTTGGYTAVALQVGEASAGTTPTIVSLRARKSGDRLTLTSAPGASANCTFMPAGSRAKRSRAARQSTVPAATGTDVSSPAVTTGAPEAGPSPAVAPSRPKSRRGQLRTTTPTPSTTPPTPEPMPAQTPSPSPTPSPEPTQTPEPSPTASPTPEPGPEPVPSPTPSPSGTPGPRPAPSPTPTPTPSPRPGH